MKHSLYLIIIVLILNILTSLANAIGPGEGGGSGKGVLCGDQLKVLDLYEAEMRGRTLPKVSGDGEQEAVRFFMDYLEYISEPGFYRNNPKDKQAAIDLIRKLWRDVRKLEDSQIFRFTDRNLPFLDDAMLPEGIRWGCQFVQIAHHYHEPRKNGVDRDLIIEINRSLAKKLLEDPIQMIGLLMHEIAYSIITNSKNSTGQFIEVNSDEIRKVVGSIITGKPLESILDIGYVSIKRIWCGFGGSKIIDGSQEYFEFYTRDLKLKGQQGLAFYFNKFKNLKTLTRTYGFLEGGHSTMLTDLNYEPNKPTISIQKLLPNPVHIIDYKTNYFPQLTQFIVRSGIESEKTWVVEIARGAVSIKGYVKEMKTLFMRAYEWGTPEYSKPSFSTGSCNTEYVRADSF